MENQSFFKINTTCTQKSREFKQCFDVFVLGIIYFKGTAKSRLYALGVYTNKGKL